MTNDNIHLTPMRSRKKRYKFTSADMTYEPLKIRSSELGGEYYESKPINTGAFGNNH